MAFVCRPWLDARVIALDADLLAIDKPSGITVHGGDEARGDDVVSRLRSWLAERSEPDYLGVHQRLDKDASGVLVFTRNREVNALVARDVEGHLARRIYLAAVTDGGLRDGGQLEHRLEHGRDGVTRPVKQGGQHSLARYRVLARHAGRALVELRPETGRTHQLRAQLAAVGSPIAGDGLYGGSPALRLMLHARALELPSLSRQFEVEEPSSMLAWVRGEPASLGSHSDIERALADALVLRWSLFGQATAFRLCNESADSLPGVTVDRYGDYALLSVSTREAADRRDELAELLVELGACGVYAKLRERTDLRRADVSQLAPPEPIAGEAASSELSVEEDGLHFAVRLADGMSTGLFVDQRDNRALVRGLSAGARVLNLFAYTCSFSVAAARGGAREVTSVDLSQPALDRGKHNFELNGLDPSAHQFVRADVIQWLRRSRERGERFDLVILDPPSFGTRSKRSTFDVARGFASVAADAMALLGSGGKLLAVTNHRKTSRQRLRKMLHDASRQARRPLAQIKDLGSPLDCPDGPDGPWPMKSALVSVR